MTQLKEPLPSQVQTGYMINKAVDNGTKYLNHALECLTEAVTDTNRQGDGIVVQNVELGTARRLIYEALAGLQKAEEAHLILGDIMAELDYRGITNEDFAEFGAGGVGR